MNTHRGNKPVLPPRTGKHMRLHRQVSQLSFVCKVDAPAMSIVYGLLHDPPCFTGYGQHGALSDSRMRFPTSNAPEPTIDHPLSTPLVAGCCSKYPLSV
eukprot:1160086-Pelagomonas_calceolata.AAC.4